MASNVVPKTLRETPESSSSSVIRRDRTSLVRSSKMWLLYTSRELVRVHIVVVHDRQDRQGVARVARDYLLNDIKSLVSG